MEGNFLLINSSHLTDVSPPTPWSWFLCALALVPLHGSDISGEFLWIIICMFDVSWTLSPNFSFLERPKKKKICVFLEALCISSCCIWRPKGFAKSVASHGRLCYMITIARDVATRKLAFQRCRLELLTKGSCTPGVGAEAAPASFLRHRDAVPWLRDLHLSSLPGTSSQAPAA